MDTQRMQLLMKPDGWKREFLRPDGALQVGKGWINGVGDKPIEIWMRLPENHHVLEFGWQERARMVAERKLNADPMRNSTVVTLDLGD